jgi:hypothetical protein
LHRRNAGLGPAFGGFCTTSGAAKARGRISKCLQREARSRAPTPVSVAFAARHIRMGQQCGSSAQQSPRKASGFRHPARDGGVASRNLLCTVQRQICLFFAQ